MMAVELAEAQAQDPAAGDRLIATGLAAVSAEAATASPGSPPRRAPGDEGA
jgi:hypothetical protein